MYILINLIIITVKKINKLFRTMLFENALKYRLGVVIFGCIIFYKSVYISIDF